MIYSFLFLFSYASCVRDLPIHKKYTKYLILFYYWRDKWFKNIRNRQTETH